MAVLLKFQSIFCRTHNVHLTNCEINLILIWSVVSVISFVTGETKSAIADTKLHIPIVTLSTQDSIKVLDQ